MILNQKVLSYIKFLNYPPNANGNASFSAAVKSKFTSDMGIGLVCIVLGIFFIYREKLKLF